MKRAWHSIEEAAILIALGLAPLLWGGVDIGIETASAAQGEARRLIALALIFGLMGVAGLARLARRLLERAPDPLVRTGADWPAAALLIWMAIAGIASRYRYASLIEWYRVAAVLLLIWLIANRPAQPRRRALFAGIVVLAGAVAAARGVREWIPEALSNNPVWRVFGGFYNPTVFAAFLVLVIPLAGALAFRTRETAYRVLWTFIGLLMTFALYLTGSRGGWLAFGVEALVFGALLVVTSPRRRVLVMVGVPVLLVLLGGPLLLRPMRERLFPTVPREEQSNAFRVLTWRATTQMAAARPILGFGPGTFQYVFPRYALAGFTRMAHNTYLQIASEAGLPALLAFLALLGACGTAGARALRRHVAGADRLVIIGALAGAAGFLIMNLLDWGWYVGGVASTFALLLGLMLNASRPDEALHAPPVSPPRKGRKKAKAERKAVPHHVGAPPPVPRKRVLVFLLALLAIILASVPPTLAAWASVRAMDSLNLEALGDTAGSDAAMREAAALMPLDAAYYRQLALLAGYPQGINELRRATALQPTHALNHVILAQIYEAGSRLSEAADEYRAALRLNPHYLTASRQLGDLLLRMGETGPAEQAYAQVIAFQRSEGGRVRALEGSVEPEYAYAHYGLARIEMAQGRFAQALTDLQSTINILDDYDRSTRPLAQQLAAIGEADPKVLQALDRLRAAALYRMALCTLRVGGPGAAARADELRSRAEKLAPDTASAVGREGPPWPGP